MDTKRLVSIITPVLNEQDNLEAFARAVAEKLFPLPGFAFEVILVDDGSTDGSWEKIERLAAGDARFSGVRLSRNFGSHYAIAAGIDRAVGDAAVILACDLQDPVEAVVRFIAEWASGYEIVWGRRATRKDRDWRILASKAFTVLLRRWAMPRDSRFTTGSFLLMDRKVMDCFRLFEDSSRLTFAMVAWTGFRQQVVEYHRAQRRFGRSGWTFSRMLAGFYNAILAYSTLPIKVITVVSLLSMLVCFPIAGYIVFLYLAGRTGNIGWISTVLTVFGFSSLILLQLAVIAEYLHRVYLDASRRPLYFVSDDTVPGRYTCSRPKRPAE